MDWLSDPCFWLMATFVAMLALRVPIAVSLGLAAMIVGWKWHHGLTMFSYN